MAFVEVIIKFPDCKPGRVMNKQSSEIQANVTRQSSQLSLGRAASRTCLATASSPAF